MDGEGLYWTCGVVDNDPDDLRLAFPGLSGEAVHLFSIPDQAARCQVLDYGVDRLYQCGLPPGHYPVDHAFVDAGPYDDGLGGG
jgi:hypothetical protein